MIARVGTASPRRGWGRALPVILGLVASGCQRVHSDPAERGAVPTRALPIVQPSSAVPQAAAQRLVERRAVAVTSSVRGPHAQVVDVAPATPDSSSPVPNADARTLPPARTSTSPPVATILASAGGGPSPQPDARPSAFRAWAGDDSSEQVLVELQIDHAANRTVLAYRRGAQALIPVGALLELGEQAFRRDSAGRIEATVGAGHAALDIDPRRDTMRLGLRGVPLSGAQRIVTDSELYVAASALATLFDTQILVDWQDLTVTFMDADKLPIGLRLERETARDAFERRHANQLERPASLGAEYPTWDGLGVDYSVLAAGPQPLSGGGDTRGVGADVLGGALELGAQSVGPTGAGQAEGTGSWTGVWEDQAWLRELRLGDGYATGPETRPERGLILTNAPYVRPSTLGTAAYAGQLDSGWTIEAYSAGRLVALDSTDPRGAFAVTLPVSYGENPVDFVAYGPGGQIVQFNQTYRTPDQQLPLHDFEYGLTLGQCPAPVLNCQATGNLDLHYGATGRLTLRAGIDQFWRDSLSNRTYPYATVLYAPINAVAIDLTGIGGSSAAATLQFEPSVNVQATANYTTYTTDSAPALPVAGLRSTWALTAFLRPIPASGFFFFDAQANGTTTTTGTMTNGLLQASVQTHDVRLEPYVRVEENVVPGVPTTTSPYVGLDAFVLPHPRWGQLLGTVWARFHVEQQITGAFQAFQIYVDRPLSAALRVELGAGQQLGVPGTTFTASLTTNLPSARGITSVTTPTVGPATASQYIQGSVLWDRTSSALRYAPGPSLERAGLTGRVFIDENGNGRWDPGEPVVAGVRILASNNNAMSDSTGTYRIWDLNPFDTVTVMVDSSSIDSPLLVPNFTAVTLVLGPNRFRTLDIPLERAGVVEGQVLEDTPQGRAGVPSLPLVLVNRRTGIKRRLGTFSDGGFYLLGVVPGDYELIVDDRALRALHAAAAPLQFNMEAGPNGGGASGLELVLTPMPGGK